MEWVGDCTRRACHQVRQLQGVHWKSQRTGFDVAIVVSKTGARERRCSRETKLLFVLTRFSSECKGSAYTSLGEMKSTELIPSPEQRAVYLNYSYGAPPPRARNQRTNGRTDDGYDGRMNEIFSIPEKKRLTCDVRVSSTPPLPTSSTRSRSCS